MNEEQKKKLSETLTVHDKLSWPFRPEDVQWRQQGPLMVPYITARHVMQRLDAVVGAGAWTSSFEIHGVALICTIHINHEGEWIGKADGSANIGATEDDVKGVLSDAFKRAGVHWGIGRYLYLVPKCEPGSEKLPDWATPQGWAERHGKA